MNRASPVDLRKAMEVASVFVKAGILFVPMPVADKAEFEKMIEKSADRLTELAKPC